jgi:hypothetical protein
MTMSARKGTRAADSILDEARTTAASVVDRFRRAIKAYAAPTTDTRTRVC